MINKIKVGIVPCLADLYNKLFDPARIEELRQFAADMPAVIGSELIEFEVGKISSTKEQIMHQMAEMTSNGADMIVMLLAPYCPSGAVAPAVMGSEVPVVLWPAQTIYELDPASINDLQISLSHGVHAVQDIANVLRKQGKAFGILHKHHLEDDFCQEIEQWAKAAKIYTAFKRSKPVQIGGHFENMLDLQIADAKFISDCKFRNASYDISRLDAEIKAVADADIASLIECYKNEFKIAADISDEMLISTARGELAVRTLMKKTDSKACGINFQTLCNDARIGDAMHIAACRLMAEGKGYAGEGDWVTAAFVYAMQAALKVASFSEIFSVDYKNGKVLLKHWGEANINMAKNKPCMISSTFNEENKAQFCIADMEFLPGNVTLINLNAAPNGNGQIISIYGEITDECMPNLPGPRALFKPAMQDIHKLLDEYAYNGGSHHLALVNGCAKNILKKLAKLTGWSYISL